MGVILDKIKAISVARADEETVKTRKDICEACDEYIKSTTTCKKCGCFMNIKNKLQAATCPIGKW